MALHAHGEIAAITAAASEFRSVERAGSRPTIARHRHETLLFYLSALRHFGRAEIARKIGRRTAHRIGDRVARSLGWKSGRRTL